MKRGLVIFVLAMLIPVVTLGQTTFGVTGGVNMAKWSGDDAEFHEMGVNIAPAYYMGIAAGVFANMKLGENLAFRPELLYSQKGSKYNEEIEGVAVELKMIFAYIEVPLLLQFTLSSSDAMDVFLIGGGCLGYNMSAKMKGKVSGFGMSEELDEDMKDEVNALDYGVIFGAGVVINKSIEIVARYNMGFATVPDPEDDEDIDIKNSAIEIRAGFRLSK